MIIQLPETLMIYIKSMAWSDMLVFSNARSFMSVQVLGAAAFGLGIWALVDKNKMAVLTKVGAEDSNFNVQGNFPHTFYMYTRLRQNTMSEGSPQRLKF